ncbi:3-hydroxyisobutyrate dehydrogenase [Trinickia symbiotica]|uniref:NAD(P)-dependent oxidoreductase n=1 Tax=Trinickia symbiotica TaxID=863227 RepID=A0A2N7WL11_9BURK|nr:NAD(P)-dependent oxidoreductase [Trinickia symbiotica]PMS30100.1 NAD(P)-dependent oxidoreductase [Trinickia symbiotica]PPK41094.1 3-hydroxyisobutyrate dehydrogenase [Trinickia symbiotica]
MNKIKVGFVGLGRMGQGMARNLANAGVDLSVFDLNVESVSILADAGARAASDLAALAHDSDVVFTSLPGPPQIEQVVLGANGILENLRPGATLFELSTSSVALASELDMAFKRKGCAILDAPVSGGPGGAASGNLALWVGGDRAVFDRHLDLLRIVGKWPRHVGRVGAGTVVKLVHNMTAALFCLSMAETFSLGVKAGVDPLELWQALRLGAIGQSSPLNMLTRSFLPGKYDVPSFAMELLHKDIKLANSLAKELDVPMPLARMTLEEISQALAHGLGGHDSAAFMKLQLRRADVQIAVDSQRLQQALIDDISSQPNFKSYAEKIS